MASPEKPISQQLEVTFSSTLLSMAIEKEEEEALSFAKVEQIKNWARKNYHIFMKTPGETPLKKWMHLNTKELLTNLFTLKIMPTPASESGQEKSWQLLLRVNSGVHPEHVVGNVHFTHSHSSRDFQALRVPSWRIIHQSWSNHSGKMGRRQQGEFFNRASL